MIPFLKVSDSMMFAVSQGTTRRGAYASYLPIDHPEIEEFLQIRKATGGDANRKCLNLHHGVLIPDRFMHIIQTSMQSKDCDDSWELKDPNSGEVVKTVSARYLWETILELRHGAGRGEPYLAFSDTMQAGLPAEQQALGLKVNQSNLCSEIVLPTNEQRTAVCCLSSLNAEKFSEWPDTLVADLVTMLDNVIEHYIRYVAPNVPRNKALSFSEFEKYVRKERRPFTKSAYSAYRERAVGLGMMGFHSWLQNEGVAFESALAQSYNHRLFETVRRKADETTEYLARVRGPAPDTASRRNSHCLAVAPTASNSIICGGVSAGIEPRVANYYVHKTDSGNFVVKNKALDKVLSKYYTDTEEAWKSIRDNNGSCQHLEELTDGEKDVFKTAYELDQSWVIELAAHRQQFIDQGQSVNLFFNPPKTKDPDVHRAYLRYYHGVHVMAWQRGLKTLYYCRTRAARQAENVALKIPEIKDTECLSCEG